MKLYAQMYSVKEACDADFFETLKAIKEMGYDGVEFAGFYDSDIDTLAKYMKELGLEAFSAHISLDLLTKELDQQIQILKKLGIKYVVCPYGEIHTREEAEELAGTLEVIARRTLAEGLELLYHNHSHELVKDQDTYVLDLLFETIGNDLLKQESDVYWLAHADVDPIAYLAKHRQRNHIIHLKQMSKDSKENVAADQGSIDFGEIIRMIPDAKYVYEQEHTRQDMMADMARSAKYIKSLT